MQLMSESDSDLASVLTLVTHERQARDRGWWSMLERCYTPEATIRASWFDGTGRSLRCRPARWAHRVYDDTYTWAGLPR